MPKDLPLGNGRFLINFDARYSLADIYYPYAGRQNHGYRCRSGVGVWVDGQFSWVSSADWQRQMVYAPETLVTRVTAVHRSLDLVVTFLDAVDPFEDILVRRVVVRNLGDTRREVRIFLHYDLALGGTRVGNTVFYHPARRALVGYREDFYLLINVAQNDRQGVEAWSMGYRDPESSEGTWRHAESGVLPREPIAFGSVDCVVGVHLGNLGQNEEAAIHNWVAVGSTLDQVEARDGLVRTEGATALLQRTSEYWRGWVNKEHLALHILPTAVSELFKRSLLLIRLHVNEQGGIIAAADSDISFPFYPRPGPPEPVPGDPFRGYETYSYVWPRDGALSSLALDRAGYSHLSQQFFQFCNRVLVRDKEKGYGYFLQKYTPTGAVGSNVIPWVDAEGKSRLPIQEDETALVLFGLWQHYTLIRDWEFVFSLYWTLIRPCSDFLLQYRDPSTGLPGPSQDLWEERDGVHAFTVAAVWAGLQGAAGFAELVGDEAQAKLCRTAALEIKEAVKAHFYDSALGRYVRTLQIQPDGSLKRDPIIDVSAFALCYFGMFEPDEPEIERTMEAVIRRLWCKTAIGGMARFENDGYCRIEQADPEAVPGNPWFMCTLWVAQYHIQRAKSQTDLMQALRLLEWVTQRALPSGVLSEQMHPNTGEPVSASPLTWCHATFVLAVQEYLDKQRQLNVANTAS